MSATAFALTNIDDKNGQVMMQNTKARIYTSSTRTLADFRCKMIEERIDGMLLQIDGDEVWVNFIGTFNASNLLQVYGTAILLGVEREEILRVMSMLRPVRGRLECVRSDGGRTAIVDYAHTPDALKNVLDTINEVRKPKQNIYTVVGCGGNRDKSKRPEMARIAVEGSMLTILTSDNPRNERPEDILTDMTSELTGSEGYLVISDRREAIKTAIMMSGEGDIILVAGKGHETYQEVEGVRHHFDDREEVLTLIEKLKK